MLLGEILIRKNWISWQQLDSVLIQQAKNPKKLGELLLESKSISVEKLERALQEEMVTG